MKTKELRAMKPDERAEALKKARTDLMHERGVASMGGAVRNPGQMRALRTRIARILTVERENAKEAGR